MEFGAFEHNNLYLKNFLKKINFNKFKINFYFIIENVRAGPQEKTF